MLRVFWSLAVADVLVLVGAGVLGLSAESERAMAQHLGLGVFAAILTCLIHAVAFTYFTATGKMMRQAISLGGLDATFDHEIRRFKRTIGRAVGPAILLCVATVALGAAALRSAGTESGAMAGWHLGVSVLTVLVNVAVFIVEADVIARNRALMDTVFSQYGRRRGHLAAIGGGGQGGQESTNSDAHLAGRADTMPDVSDNS